MTESGLLRRGRRLRVLILGALAALLLFVVLAFVITVYVIETRGREEELARSLRAVQTLFAQKLEKDAGLMEAVVTAMMSNAAIADAFTAAEGDRLRALVEPLFARLRDEHGITHLYFNDPDLTNLVRLHQPTAHGDSINRLTTLRARQSGTTVHGLELGRLGTLTLRTVLPWSSIDRRVGFVELGKEIQYLLHDIGDALGVELLVVIDKQFIVRETWEQGLRLLNRVGAWDDYPTLVLVAQTAPPTPQLARRVPWIQPGAAVKIHENGRSLSLGALPLSDLRNREIGRLLVVRDVTAVERAFQNSLLIASAVSIAAGTAVFLFFGAALARVQADYRRQHDIERQLLRASAEHHRMVQVEKLSALGTMIGQIAHQLNNPLVGVVNMAQLAERQVHDPERVRALLERISAAGADCRSFVQRMLNFSKLSASDRRPSDIRAAVHEAVSLFKQSFGRRVLVDLDLPKDAVVLAADVILLRHAVFNLLANAAQAMGGDGTVQVAMWPQPHGDRPGWRIAVTDHGPGFPADVAERLFTPFFTTRPEGTGLGLPVVLHVALLHDGFADAMNRPDGGAQFTLWLPQTEGKEAT